jgi:hypothetical protein
MFDFLRFKNKEQKFRTVNSQDFNKLFFSHPLHQWINDDRVLKRGITAFLEALNDQDRLILTRRKRKFLLTPASGRFSCAFNGSNEYEFILVFPDLIDILRSASPERGIAILLHEAGHLVRQHSERSLNQLEAQLEADRFCAHRGYGDALTDFLKDLPLTEEVDLRLRFLETHLV